MNILIAYTRNQKYLRSSFSTINHFIKKRYQHSSHLDQIQFHQFCTQLYKVYLFDQLSSQFNKKTQKIVHNMALLQTKPYTKILEYYQKNNTRGFDDNFVVLILDSLGRIAKIYEQDYYTLRGYDLLTEQMKKDARFKNLFDDVRYGLQEGVYFSNRNISLMIEALNNLRILDQDLIIKIIKKLMRKIQIKDDEFKLQMNRKQDIQYAQIDKNKYYYEGDPISKKALLQNQKFIKILQQIAQSNKGPSQKNLHQTQQLTQIQTIVSSIQFNLQKSKKFITKYTDAIISIRQKYLKLIKSQQNNQLILTDPNLNLQLLEFQQNLLNLNLITIQQIKNPSLLQNPQHNIQQINKIVNSILKNKKGFTISKFLKDITNYNQKQKNQIKSNYLQQSKNLGLCLLKISQLIKSDSKYFKNYGIAYNKWQKIVKQKISNQNHYKIDRLYKSLFFKIIKQLNVQLPKLFNFYKEQPFSISIYYLNALTDLGLHEQAINLFKELNKLDNLPNLSRQQLFNLISFLSNICQFNGSFELNKQVLSELKRRVQSGQFLVNDDYNKKKLFKLGIIQKVTILNWLININQRKNNNTYNKILEALKHQIQGIENPIANPQYAYAIHLLNHQVQLTDQTSPYLQSNYINPIYQNIYTIFKKYLKPYNFTDKNLPFIQIGFKNLKSSKSSVLFILPLQWTSISGKYVNGNILGYLNMFSLQNQVNVQKFSLSSILNIDFNALSITLKNQNQINSKFVSIIGRAQQSIVFKHCKEISETLCSISFQQNRDIKALRKITRTLQSIAKLNRSQKFNMVYEIALTVRHKIRYLLITLKKQFTLFTQQKLTQILSKNNIIKKIQQLINSLAQNLPTIQPSKNNIFDFVGKRQTIDIINDSHSSNLQFEFIDHSTYQNQQYCQYQKWNQILVNNLGQFNIANINSENPLPLTRLFLYMTNVNKNQGISIGPSSGIRRPLISNYPVLWQPIYKMYNDQLLNEALRIQNIVRLQIKTNNKLQKIIQLQNFKQQLKNKSLQYINNLLLRFNFIEKLIQKHLAGGSQKQIQLIERDPADYFNYLEQKTKRYLLNSPFLNYMLQKIQKKDKLKRLLELRQQKKKQWMVMVRKNQMSYNDYNILKKKIQSQVVAQLQTYKNDVMEQRLTILGSPGMKMFKTEINEIQFSNLINRLDFYDKQDDEDIILSNGCLQQALKIKRFKSEQKLIKLRIANKLNNNLSLSQLQNKYVEKWKSQALTSIYQYKVNKNYSKQYMEQILSQKDILILAQQFSFSNLIHHHIPLTDFILQFSLFYDQTALKFIQTKILQNQIITKYKIPNHLFEFAKNKQSSYYLNQLQKNKFSQANQITDDQITQIVQFSKLLKQDLITQRAIYQNLYSNIVSEIKQINQISKPTEILTDWYTTKQVQFQSGYNPLLINDFKKTQIQKIWLKLFEKSYSSSTTLDIKNFVRNLIQRFYLIKKNPPIYFSQLIIAILTHPQTSMIDKKTLIGTLQLLRIKVIIDSEDIKKLAKHFDTQKLSNQQILDRLYKCSNKDYAGHIYSKMIKL